MDLYTIFFILHIVGIAIGVGGATVSDLLFFRSLRDRRISMDEFNLLDTVSKIVTCGIALLLFSGASMFTIQYMASGTLAVSEAFAAKLTIVLVLILNGLLFHKTIFPRMVSYVNKRLDKNAGFIRSLWLFAMVGTTSIVSWYTILFLGAVRELPLPYLFIMTGYFFILSAAILISYLVISHEMFAPRKEEKEELEQAWIWKWGMVALAVFQLGVLVAVFGGAERIIALKNINLTFLSATQIHEVCIRESAPWFYPEVIEIEKGDTVTWVHCDEEGETAAHSSALPHAIFIKQALAHGGEVPSAAHRVHTHPIMALAGPELFSSNFAPVGHKEDNGQFSHTFTEEGVYEYICPTHPYMKGIIAVGEEAEKTSLWPPDEVIKPSLLPTPSVPGIGEIWVDTQFQRIPGQEFPGTITVIDAENWEITDVIADAEFNNPHNLWSSNDGQYVYQTQWHSNKLSQIDANTKEVIRTVEVGNAPAHVFVHPDTDRVYVTLNNENRVVVLNTHLDILGEIQTSFGAHGIWIDPSGTWMSVASTLEEKLNIIDLETEEVVATFDAPGLPLATQITHDGRYAMISLLLEGKVRFIDLETMEQVEDVAVGTMPIWATPGPNGEYAFVANSGSSDVSVISLDTLEVVKTLPAAGGAHGIIFGPKQGGGYYGYVSHKFARVVGVIDVDQLELVGHIQLGEDQWGGNGILTLPSAYSEFTQ